MTIEFIFFANRSKWLLCNLGAILIPSLIVCNQIKVFQFHVVHFPEPFSMIFLWSLRRTSLLSNYKRISNCFLTRPHKGVNHRWRVFLCRVQFLGTCACVPWNLLFGDFTTICAPPVRATGWKWLITMRWRFFYLNHVVLSPKLNVTSNLSDLEWFRQVLETLQSLIWYEVEWDLIFVLT